MTADPTAPAAHHPGLDEHLEHDGVDRPPRRARRARPPTPADRRPAGAQDDHGVHQGPRARAHHHGRQRGPAPPVAGGQPVGAKQFEIVGVWVTVAAGSRYSASVDPSMLSLVAASPAQTVVPTSEFAKQWGATAAEGRDALADDRRLGLLQGRPRHDERAEPGLQPAGLHGQHDRQEAPAEDLLRRPDEVAAEQGLMRRLRFPREPEPLPCDRALAGTALRAARRR